MRETRLSGSMSGMWKRGTVWIMRHRLTKGPETDRPNLTYRATSRLYHSGAFLSQGRVGDMQPRQEAGSIPPPYNSSSAWPFGSL